MSNSPHSDGLRRLLKGSSVVQFPRQPSRPSQPPPEMPDQLPDPPTRMPPQPPNVPPEPPPEPPDMPPAARSAASVLTARR